MITNVEEWELMNLGGLPYPICSLCGKMVDGSIPILASRKLRKLACSSECAVKFNALAALSPKQALALAIELLEGTNHLELERIRSTYEAMP